VKLALVAPEVHPWSKTGGLGDVAGALPPALARLGVQTATITPLHKSARRKRLDPTSIRLRVPVGAGAIETPVWRSGDVWFLEHDPFFDRDGLYSGPWGDHGDNLERFVFLCRGALELLKVIGVPDILHAHDWPSGLLPCYARTLYANEFQRSRTVTTIHNLSYQGHFAPQRYPTTGLDWGLYHWRQLEFYGKLNCLKAGLVFSDAITTVSPTYAREIRTQEHGYGLDGLLRERGNAVRGILNGVDYAEWDPGTDRALPARYTASDLRGKSECKAALQRHFGLPERSDVPLVVMVTRLAEQKGIELVIQSLDRLLWEDLQFVVLGSGDSGYEHALRTTADRRPDRMRTVIGFDDGLAHRLEAGADLFLMPSRFEPCGLNQIYSLRYGTIPIVRSTGGLADTVEDNVTGFTFGPYWSDAMMDAVYRALAAWRDPQRRRALQQAGMSRDFSWDASARRYLALFEELLSER
jgi:starch synthase